MTDRLVWGSHPVLAAVGAATAALAGVGQVQPVFMSPAQKEAALLGVAVVEAQLAELKARLLVSCGDLAAEQGAVDVAAWLAGYTHADLRSTRADLALAKGLEKWPAVAAGMAAGTVSPAHARVVLTALDALPARLGAEIATRAEQELLGYCGRFTPDQVRRLGRRILEVVAPEIAEAEEARALAQEEKSAWAKTRLTLRPVGDGTTRISGLLPDHAATRLRTYLEAFTSPRHHGPAATREETRIPYPRRLGRAFCALLEHLDPHRLPDHGGDATTLILTLTLDDLRRDLATAGLLTGEEEAGADLSAAQARRLACTAQIIPAVLGGHSEILDLGHTDRLFRPAQRKALRLRDHHCRAEGCTIPATWCEAHHLTPWTHGGPTNLANGILLCAHHHHRIHDPDYETHHLPDRTIRIRRRRE